MKKIAKQRALSNQDKAKKKTNKGKQYSNWPNMPRDIMITICSKVGTIGILARIQFVCTSWRELSKDPILFRSIVISPKDLDLMSIYRYNYIFLVKKALSRSNKQLTEVYIKGFICTDQILYSIVHKSSSLRSLRIKCLVHRSDDLILMALARKHILLEEFEFEFESFMNAGSVIREIGRSCSRLKCLRLIVHHKGCTHYGIMNEGYEVKIFCSCTGQSIADAIAETMPQLEKLCLSIECKRGKGLRDKGLTNILDKCTNLQYLDLRGCRLEYVEPDTLEACKLRINHFRIDAA